jgi:hypothetical protein
VPVPVPLATFDVAEEVPVPVLEQSEPDGSVSVVVLVMSAYFYYRS